MTGDPFYEWIESLNRDQERRSVAAGTAGQNENETRRHAKIRKAKELPRPPAGWRKRESISRSECEELRRRYEKASNFIALDKVYRWISWLEQRVPKHLKHGRFQVRKFRRSAVGRQLAKFFMQPTSLVGQKNSAVSRKNNRVPFKLWVYERYITKKEEHDQKNHGHPKYSYGQFRIDLKDERSKESSAYADFLRPMPKRRFILADALRKIVKHVASSETSEI